MSIVEGLKRSVKENPAKLASVCGGTRLTFQEMDERVNRISSALAGLGITRGERVSLLALNCHRFFELYYGVPRLKKSFGSAFKIWGDSMWGNFSVYAKLVVVTAAVLGEPMVMSQLGAPQNHHIYETANQLFNRLRH